MLTIVKGPYLQWPTENSITIMWETSEPASSTVTILMAERIHSGYYKKPEQVLLTVGEKEYSTIHQLTVTHLEPNTLYFYRVRSVNERDEIESGHHFLKTAVRRGESFSFTVTSETGG